MKCICGYEKGSDWISGEFVEDINPTGDDFIDLKGSYYVDGADYYRTPHEVHLYICPKCGTVRASQ